MVRRKAFLRAVEAGLKASPVTALLGPRQCGKTTLAREIARKHRAVYFDLERMADAARLQNPERVLGGLRGLVVLDEIQRLASLFPLLRVLSDRRPNPARFLILGSADPWTMKRTSESLAGRVRFVPLSGFGLAETGWTRMRRLWLRGGFPRAFLAPGEAASLVWREDFIRTFLERDLPQMEVRVPAETMRRFWGMVAHYHGQVWNASEIGASLGFSHNTARRHLDELTGAMVVRQLPPFFANLGKRTVKSPKVYVRDSGILHSLLGIGTTRELESHPKFGASWEGFAMEEVLKVTGDRHAFFWATHAGAELDLVVQAGGANWGFEFKVSDAPAVTKSMRIAMKDLGLRRLWVVHPGRESHPLDKGIDTLSLRHLDRLPRPLVRP